MGKSSAGDKQVAGTSQGARRPSRSLREREGRRNASAREANLGEQQVEGAESLRWVWLRAVPEVLQKVGIRASGDARSFGGIKLIRVE